MSQKLFILGVIVALLLLFTILVTPTRTGAQAPTPTPTGAYFLTCSSYEAIILVDNRVGIICHNAYLPIFPLGTPIPTCIPASQPSVRPMSGTRYPYTGQ